jgi:hypothetical protein
VLSNMVAKGGGLRGGYALWGGFEVVSESPIDVSHQTPSKPYVLGQNKTFQCFTFLKIELEHVRSTINSENNSKIKKVAQWKHAQRSPDQEKYGVGAPPCNSEGETIPSKFFGTRSASVTSGLLR